MTTSALLSTRCWSCWLVAGCLLLQACPGKTRQTKREEPLPSKSGLKFRVNRFNQLLRWNHFQGAKQYVLPKLRSQYILKWERERDLRKIAGFAIRDVSWNKKGDEATVLVMRQEYRSDVMSVKKLLRQQLWRADKGSWFYAGEKSSPKTNTKSGS